MPHEAPISHAVLERRSDAELVAIARESLPAGVAGEETARRCIALVYERHRELVRAMCAAKAPRNLVDDLEGRVAERFVRTCHLGNTPIENPGGLLVTTTRRVIASHYDRARPDPTPWDSLPEPVDSEHGYEAAEAQEFVEGLLGILSPRQREVLRYRFGEDLTSAETAARMGTTAGNIDVIAHRAVAQLRREAET